MHIKFKRRGGITLVSLVITIIILLILATISIQTLTKTSWFENVNKAKLETKRSQIKEWLSLNLMETQTTSYDKTDSEILEIARGKAEKSEELKKLGKVVNVDGELSTEEDGEKVSPYFYVIVDKDVYKVENGGVKFIGEQGKFSPLIKITSITNTSNSITVKVKTSRNEGGILKYYIKKADDTKYSEEPELETTELQHTFEGLIQGVKYNVKIVAEVPNKKTAEVEGEQTTKKVADLTIEVNTANWSTSKTVTITVTNNNYSNIRYTIDGSIPTITTGKEYLETFTITSNCTITAVAFDEIGQIGSIATNEITTIDTEKPDLVLSKITYYSGFDSWEFNNSSVDTSGVLILSNSGSNAVSNFIKTNGERWYATWDAYTTQKSEVYNPIGGMEAICLYYDENNNSVISNNGYSYNGFSTDLTLNTWKNNISWDGYSGYGSKIKYTRIDFCTGNQYTQPVTKIRNMKIYGQLYNTFYLINVSESDDKSGIALTKYATGNQTVGYFSNNGNIVDNNQIKVTANGIYTVYTKDVAGNEIVKTIEITNIDNTKPIINSVTASTNSINIKASDMKSGIVGYEVSTSNSIPTNFTRCNNQENLNVTINGLKSGKTYYVWIKDAAGNISQSKLISI